MHSEKKRGTEIEFTSKDLFGFGLEAAKKVDIEAVLNVRSDKSYASGNDSRSGERERERAL